MIVWLATDITKIYSKGASSSYFWVSVEGDTSGDYMVCDISEMVLLIEFARVVFTHVISSKKVVSLRADGNEMDVICRLGSNRGNRLFLGLPCGLDLGYGMRYFYYKDYAVLFFSADHSHMYLITDKDMTELLDYYSHKYTMGKPFSKEFARLLIELKEIDFTV